MSNLDMRNLRDHYPHREDQVEAWIKERRDNRGDRVVAGAGWQALDDLLDEYRLAADTGRTLEEMVNAEIYEEEREISRPKKEKR